MPNQEDGYLKDVGDWLHLLKSYVAWRFIDYTKQHLSYVCIYACMYVHFITTGRDVLIYSDLLALFLSL